jgi:hypothetical protein
MKLAIKGWSVRDKADPDGEYVRIRGHEAGVAGVALRWLGIDAMTSLSIDDKRIRLARRALSGSVLRVVPLASIASVAFGCSRPWKESLAFATGGLLALALPGAGGFVGTALLLFAPVPYFFGNRLFLEFVDHGGGSVRIEFERSVLADAHIDERTSVRIVSVVEMLRLRLAAPRPMNEERELFETPAQPDGMPARRAAPSPVNTRWFDGLIRPRKTPSDLPASDGAVREAAEEAASPFEDIAVDEDMPADDGPRPRLQLNCMSCGAHVQFNDVYCGSCGRKLPFLPQ